MPQSSQNDGGKDSSIENEKKRRLNNWLEGLFYGSLPVFASFFADIESAVSIKASLYNMLLNVSVMYIGITLLITAMNDLASMLYFLKYRLFSAQYIEMMLISFFAGQVYQETSEDTSDKLPPSDYEDLDQWK